MPEVKNIFLKSKMNKDLDDRLVPKGEYRDGQNIAISRSDDADVGALENVLGNRLLTDFGLSSICGLEIIGKYMDETNNRIFVFMTNYNDTSINGLDNNACTAAGSTTPGIACYILVYNIIDNTYNTLVSGYFLNFSKTHPIYGINLIEDLLFWTDNRNQPRKINVNTAIDNPSYYYLEEHISVAKYYPFQPISLLDTAGASTMQDVVSEDLPDDSTTNPYGPSGTGANWDGDKEFLRDKFVRFSYRLKYDDNEYSLIAPFTQVCFVPEQDGYFLQNAGHTDLDRAYKSTEVDFVRNKINQIKFMIPAPDNATPHGVLPNMGTWQEAFEYFKVKEIQILYREAGTAAIKVVEEISKDEFILAGTATHYEYTYKSQKPFKTLPENDIVRVNDLAPVRALAQESVGNRIIYGNFANRHTPPLSLNYSASVGIKGGSVMRPGAVVNEAARIEYQNHTLKQNRTYKVGIVLSDMYGRQSSVIPASVQGADTIFHDYKTSGWSPGVITNDDTWPGDTLQIGFTGEIPTNIDQEGYPGLYSGASHVNNINPSNPLGWYTYKIVVKQTEQDYYNVYFPGIMSGYTGPGGASAPSLADPIGHIVLHGDNINKIPKDLGNIGPETALFSSGEKFDLELPKPDSESAEHIGGLLGFTDPIHQWGPAQWEQVFEFDARRKHDWAMSRQNSSIILFGRVTNSSPTLTGQWYPYATGSRVKSDMAITIGKLTDLSLATGATPIVQPEYYNAQDNPTVARLKLSTESGGAFPGEDSASLMRPILAISETEPVRSNIDIYWETSTAGTISALNSLIKTNDNISVEVWYDFASSSFDTSYPIINILFSEGMAATSNVLKRFQAYNATGGGVLAASMTLASVTDMYGNDVTNKFELNTPDGGTSYTLDGAAGELFWHRADMNYNYYSPTIIVTSGGVDSTLPIGPLLLRNAPPVFVAPAAPVSVSEPPGRTLYIASATNGSADTTKNKKELTWSLSAPSGAGYFFITTSGTIEGSAALSSSPFTPAGVYSITLTATDGGGYYVESSVITVTIT